jgi:hypothetical protein
MPRGFKGNSLSIGPTPLPRLDRVTDAAPATALARMMRRGHHRQSARARAHGLGVTIIARIRRDMTIRHVISLSRWKRGLWIGDNE